MPQALKDGGKRVVRCSKRLCERCASQLGEHLDLCPIHAELIEEYQLAPRLLPLLAQDEGGSNLGRGVACDLIEQVTGIGLKSKARLAPAFKPRDRDDWKEYVGELAAVLEYEGGFPRVVAERKALARAGERPAR
jgi:hypothetical protein